MIIIKCSLIANKKHLLKLWGGLLFLPSQVDFDADKRTQGKNTDKESYMKLILSNHALALAYWNSRSRIRVRAGMNWHREPLNLSLS